MQDHSWHNGVCKHIALTASDLSITTDGVSTAIEHILLTKIRVLAGVPITPTNNAQEIVMCYSEKINVCVRRPQWTSLHPQDVFFGHERFWLPSIIFAAPVLAIPCNVSILALLYKALVPKIKVMKTFPTSLRSAPSPIGGLGLRSLEITSGVQAINDLISLISSSTAFKLLLTAVLESQQLEISVRELFFLSSFSDLAALTTPSWITHL